MTSAASSRPAQATSSDRQHAWLLWGIAWVALLLLKSSDLNRPYWWDELGCYWAQARELSDRPAQWLFGQPPFVRPLGFTAYIASILHWVSRQRWVVRAAALLWTSGCIPATYLIVRTLGGTRRTGQLAALLCFVTPLYFAQAGLIQTDLPAATLVAWAWLAMLSRRTLAFCVLSALAVLVKESSYYVGLAAAVLFYLRALDAAGPRRSPLALRTLLATWPATIPAWTTLIWLFIHRALTGVFIVADHTANMADLPAFLSALSHNFVEGGHLVLGVFAARALRRAWPSGWSALAHPSASPSVRAGQVPHQAEILTTGLVWLLLPVAFPASLYRYMCHSLPVLAALAALGLCPLATRLSTAGRRWLPAAVVLAVALCGVGPSLHQNSPHHLEGSLAYRDMRDVHVRSVAAAQAQAPVRILSEFPFIEALADPEAGYVTKPLVATPLHRVQTDAAFCQHDLVIEAGPPTAATQDRLGRGLLTLTHTFGQDLPASLSAGAYLPSWARHDNAVRLYRIRCPAAPPPVAAP